MLLAPLAEAVQLVSNWWTLAALGIAAFVGCTRVKPRAKVPMMVLIVAIGLAPVFAKIHSEAVYHVRIIIIGADSIPVQDIKVWSSMGGEPKRLAGSWEVDVPSRLGSTGKLTVWAVLQGTHLKGSADVLLGTDYNPTVTIKLEAYRKERGKVYAGMNVAACQNELRQWGREVSKVIRDARSEYAL